MKNQTPHKTRTIRNLIIFVIGALGLPWLGYALDVMGGNNPHNQESSLGWLLLLTAPLAVSLLLRAFGGDGWKTMGLRPNLRGNGKWYALALLIHPVTSISLLLVGMAIGVIAIPDGSANQLALLGQAMLIGLVPTFIKNIFEEFAWRGYMEPQVQSVVKNPLFGHLTVGVVWFSWHLPYYLVLLDPKIVASFTSLSMPIFLFISFLFTLGASILYGELRLITNSVWAPVLMHTAGNVFVDTMIVAGFFKMPFSVAEIVMSPALPSLISILVLTAVGLWVYRKRMAITKASRSDVPSNLKVTARGEVQA